MTLDSDDGPGSHMGNVYPWLAWIAWLLIVFFVLAPLTPLYVNAFLSVAGTVLLMKASARYRAFGWKGVFSRDKRSDHDLR
jgi:hypothetical protein